MDRIEKIHRDVQSKLGDNFVSNSIAQELVTLSFLLRANSKEDSDEASGQNFYYYRESGMTALLLVLILIVMVDVAALHLLISMFSPLLAWIATLSSLYVAAVIVAQVRAIRCRPIKIENDRLYLRNGIVNLGDFPLDSVESVESSTHAEENPTESVAVSFPTSHNVVVQFKTMQTAKILFGKSKPFRVALVFVDSADDFIEALRAALAANGST